jgi:hypothetical protein
MALIALDPPNTLPRGNAIRRFWSPGSGSVEYPQSYFDPISDVQRPGVVIDASASYGPPASSNNTRAARSALSRLASTQPAEPAPMMMKSKGVWALAKEGGMPDDRLVMTGAALMAFRKSRRFITFARADPDGALPSRGR